MTFDLSLDDGRFLVKLARQAVEEYLKTQECMRPPAGVSEELLKPHGVFVTINTMKKGKEELRGCIGYPYPTTPLVEAVIDSAVNAATQDPRFPPLSVKELDNVVFEVSVLTPPQLVEAKDARDYPRKIKVGEDGLIIEKGVYKGLLLPQVPVEWEWDEEEFLCQCCNKAGLPPDYWLVKGTRVYRFQAIVFEEEKPRGEVTRKTLDGKKP